jgi:hypothetical protein
MIDECAGFAIHRTAQSGFGYNISSSAGIFTAELTLERCLILTHSLSSVKALLSRKLSHRTHPLDYECNQIFNSIQFNSYLLLK